jgi:DNA-binding MarR family transcriptional regulator
MRVRQTPAAGAPAPKASVAQDQDLPTSDAQSREILDVLTGVVKQAAAISHSIAAGFGLTPSDLLALFKLDSDDPADAAASIPGVTMKELAQRMGCDASFITAVADDLESHGLVRRQPGQRDRRVKHLVVTPEGIAVREQMMTELARRMPWSHGLDHAERGCFLALLHKMVAGTGTTAPGTPAGAPGTNTGGPE